MVKFKAKDFETAAIPLCLGNNSKDWSVDNMKRTGLNEYVYEFNVDYDPIPGDISKIMSTFHNNIMFKYSIK